MSVHECSDRVITVDANWNMRVHNWKKVSPDVNPPFNSTSFTSYDTKILGGGGGNKFFSLDRGTKVSLLVWNADVRVLGDS